MRTFIKKNDLHFIKNCIRPPVKKLKSLKQGFIETRILKIIETPVVSRGALLKKTLSIASGNFTCTWYLCCNFGGGVPDRQKVQPCRTDENETVWEQLQTFAFSSAEKLQFREKKTTFSLCYVLHIAVSV